jgi:adenylylsulfate kinase-like enzyme
MNSRNSTSCLLISGPTGVGKSAVADEVFELLKAKGVPVALVNIDELGYAAPVPVDDLFQEKLRLKNLAAIWPNYQALGSTAIIIPAVIENQTTLDAYSNALPSTNFQIIHLAAPLKDIEERLRGRSMGGSLSWHISRAAELMKILQSAELEMTEVNTQNKSIQEVALEVINMWEDIANMSP